MKELNFLTTNLCALRCWLWACICFLGLIFHLFLDWSFQVEYFHGAECTHTTEESRKAKREVPRSEAYITAYVLFWNKQFLKSIATEILEGKSNKCIWHTQTSGAVSFGYLYDFLPILPYVPMKKAQKREKSESNLLGEIFKTFILTYRKPYWHIGNQSKAVQANKWE